MNKYFAIYKPFNVMSQFTSQEGKKTLKDIFDVPNDVYPVGRLDYDSEGLLILTNDKKLNNQLLHPSFEHEREYWAQVEGEVTSDAINELTNGVDITVEGKKYHTKKCFATKFETAPLVPDRDPPIRFRQNIPTSWIKLILTEGKNRQVRKMTAAVGFPTLRLIRQRIEKCSIEGLIPGEMLMLEEKEVPQLLLANNANL